MNEYTLFFFLFFFFLLFSRTSFVLFIFFFHFTFFLSIRRTASKVTMRNDSNSQIERNECELGGLSIRRSVDCVICLFYFIFFYFRFSLFSFLPNALPSPPPPQPPPSPRINDVDLSSSCSNHYCIYTETRRTSF